MTHHSTDSTSRARPLWTAIGTVFLTSLTTLASAQIPTLPQTPIPPDIAKAINNVMAVNYGSDYDKLRGCTLYHSQETYRYDGNKQVFKTNYCIAPIKYEVKEVGGETRLYLLASGYVYDGNIGNVDTGLGGLFELYKVDDMWIMSASEPFIATGGSGRSQLHRFDLDKVGEDKYAWTGRYCDGRGGNDVCLWIMHAAIEGKIKPIAEIVIDYRTEIASEFVSHQGEGNVRYQRYEPMTDGFYPLTVRIENTSVNYDTDKEIAPRTTDTTHYMYNPSKQSFELVK